MAVDTNLRKQGMLEPQDAAKRLLAVELLGAKINGTSQLLRLGNRTLRIPVMPGAQQVELNWREPRGIGIL